MSRTTEPGRLWNRWIMVAAVAVTGLAIRQELRKPARDRTWHGALFGWLPYDFRRPTIERVRATWWAPADERLFVPRCFGIGWDINIGRLVTLLRRHHDDMRDS